MCKVCEERQIDRRGILRLAGLGLTAAGMVKLKILAAHYALDDGKVEFFN